MPLRFEYLKDQKKIHSNTGFPETLKSSEHESYSHKTTKIVNTGWFFVFLSYIIDVILLKQLNNYLYSIKTIDNNNKSINYNYETD